MFDRSLTRHINAELIVALIFIILSGFYIIVTYGLPKLFDLTLLWMFPASIMIFLTLVLVKIIERTQEKRTSRFRYLDWRR